MGDRRLVGIDLGTTHTAVAWCEAGDVLVRDFPLPQLITASTSAERALLPSALYAPLDGETTSVDAWRWSSPPWLTGEHARRRAGELPARGVLSAKSWLCHPGVDRTAAILPWGDDDQDEVPAPKISPIDASARLLEHVQRAWDASHPDAPLAEQDVILTVPASFDEVARELTVLAAERAGLRVRLLEEPQAAFYARLASAKSASEAAGGARHVLVVDVGGGTSDFSRLDVTGDDVSRVAVGDHLLLGGDNMDLALAHLVEPRLGGTLPPTRFAELVAACRVAKEALLSPGAPDETTVTLLGRGSRLIGGAQRATLRRDEVESVVLDGFFPLVARDAAPTRTRGGLVSFGLPYARDPSITAHLARFFGGTPALGDVALLLNGGVFHAPALAARIAEVLSSWLGRAPVLLPHGDPDRAVARGAVAYGLALRGRVVKIGGGSARAYYVGVGEDRAACVVPRGSEVGARHHVDLALSLLVGRAARFDLYAADHTHAAGEVVTVDDATFTRLPPLVTRLSSDGATELDVALEGELTDVGTLDLACVERAGSRRFRLAFAIRGEARTTIAPPRSSLPPRSEPAATQLLARVFGKAKDIETRDAKDLVRDLERVLGERSTWTGDAARALFDVLVPLAKGRKRTPDHERAFWSLAGYCLRPGFGHAGDDARGEAIGPLLLDGPMHREARVWQQLLVAWRRVAGGLDEATQVTTLDRLEEYVGVEVVGKKHKGPPPEQAGELLSLVASLERVPPARRAALGERIVERTWTRSDPRLWDALGRIGARAPTYASAHYVVPARVAEAWMAEIFRAKWTENDAVAHAAYRIARLTGDRARDLGEKVRLDAAKRLDAAAKSEWAKALREVVVVDEQERVQDLGDALPPGLRLG